MSKNYQTILIDPPWPYTLRKKDKSHRNEVTKHYSEMTEESILSLPMADYADPSGCALWLWTTNNHMGFAHQCIEHWGFTQKTILTWVKVTKDGSRPRIGVGHWLRNCTEHCILATRGKLTSFSYTTTLGNTSTVLMEPRREHSRKPEGMYRIIEQLQPTSSKLELFARHSRDGWDQLGDQTKKFDVA